MNFNPLNNFHPIVSSWFRDEVGFPTDVQGQAWPAVARGEHVLVTAPTGSGKTLTAFLWALNQLITGKWNSGATRVVYVSPLKALNNDIQRNLLTPLESLQHQFEKAGVLFPDIRVLTRSGDTPMADRRRMLRHPPEILITTPESLNLLLSSQGGRSILHGIKTVILDEIHGVINSKRGVHLITAVDRLVAISGEFQRIALSATIRPLEKVARYIGGYKTDGGVDPVYSQRPVTLIQSNEEKKYRIHVRFPESAVNRPARQTVWEPLVESFKEVVGKNRSTLLFVNSRKLCEKITFMMNKGEYGPVAYAHHGSLSRELRHAVEQKFKAGELQAIVATNSLEMGIDIGALDEVVLVQSPQSVSAAIQRVGRAGHQVGEVSRGVLYPTHSQDILEAAVLAPAIINRDIEEVKPVDCPLDVLAQVIISMVGVETWHIDALYSALRCSHPFHSLSRNSYDSVVNMLSGRYSETSIRELKPRVSVDTTDGTIKARKGALQALYMSGGTIPDRGYFQLRHQDTNSRIGELDEEFVWEARVGQTFTLGTQTWKIHKITHNDVFVVPAQQGKSTPPFWIAEEQNRNFSFSQKIAAFLEDADERLDSPEFSKGLLTNHHMEETAARQLVDYLKRQKDVTQCPLPHRHHCVVEFVKALPGKTPGHQIVIHTFWGGRLNRPYALALKSAWEERYGKTPEVYAANDCIFVILPHLVSAGELMGLVTRSEVERLLRKQLETSGTFGAKFRENAGRALLLPKHKFNERMPLWVSRLRSQKLLEEVKSYKDFPILLETWRTCLKDEFDLIHLYGVLNGLEAGEITWSETQTSHPSPMALNTTWRQINTYMYMTDQPKAGKVSDLSEDLLKEVVFSDDLRPRITKETIAGFEQKRKRLSPGYSPDTPDELLEWVKERLVIPESEWECLLGAIKNDHGLSRQKIVKPIEEKLTTLTLSGAGEPFVVARQMVDYIRSKTTGDDPDLISGLLKEWSRFYGPVTRSFIERFFGFPPGTTELAVDSLAEGNDLICGDLVEGSNDRYVCDSRNFEILLRQQRTGNIPVFEPIETEKLQAFVAGYQGIVAPVENETAIFETMEQLICCPLPVELWETDVFPARCPGYQNARLDELMQEGEVRWAGLPGKKLMFVFEGDRDLVIDGIGDPDSEPVRETDILPTLFTDPKGRYDFSALHMASGKSVAEFTETLWGAVWKGQISNDTFAALRKGIESRFKSPKLPKPSSRPRGRRRRVGGRSGFSRWKGNLPSAGNWFLIHPMETEGDLIELEELRKERARILLDRYGIVFRELIVKELPGFRWGVLFKALRLMELSGEILSGCFFRGVPGPQFMTREAFSTLQKGAVSDSSWWINAADPASLCGIPLKPLKSKLPKRLPTTHLVYRGERLVMISEKLGKKLTLQSPLTDALPEACFKLFEHLLTRSFKPLRQIAIETVNGNPAHESPLAGQLKGRFDVETDYGGLTLYRSVG